MIRETSTLSYREEKLKGLTDRHNEVLEALRLAGPMTDREIQNYLNKKDANEVRPRRFELASEAYGQKIEASPIKRPCRITGKKALVWRIRRSQVQQLSFDLAS